MGKIFAHEVEKHRIHIFAEHRSVLSLASVFLSGVTFCGVLFDGVTLTYAVLSYNMKTSHPIYIDAIITKSPLSIWKGWVVFRSAAIAVYRVTLL